MDPASERRRPSPYHAGWLLALLIVVGAAVAFVVAHRFPGTAQDYFGPGISGAAAWLLLLLCWVVLVDLIALLRPDMRYLDFLEAYQLPWLEKWRYKTVILFFLGGIFLGHFFWQ